MKASTERRKQWLWFTLLWCGGILAALLLSFLTKWVVHMN
jgi:hypothetical protein